MHWKYCLAIVGDSFSLLATIAKIYRSGHDAGPDLQRQVCWLRVDHQLRRIVSAV